MSRLHIFQLPFCADNQLGLCWNEFLEAPTVRLNRLVWRTRQGLSQGYTCDQNRRPQLANSGSWGVGSAEWALEEGWRAAGNRGFFPGTLAGFGERLVKCHGALWLTTGWAGQVSTCHTYSRPWASRIWLQCLFVFFSVFKFQVFAIVSFKEGHVT